MGPGCQDRHRVPGVPPSTRVPVWSMRCAPELDHRICRFFKVRFPATVTTVDSTNAADTRSP